MHEHTEAITNEVATYLTIPQTAFRLGVSPDTIRRWRKEGRIKAVFFAGKWRIAPQDADALVKAA